MLESIDELILCVIRAFCSIHHQRRFFATRVLAIITTLLVVLLILLRTGPFRGFKWHQRS